MKIKVYSGCLSSGIEIDNHDISSYTKKQLKVIIKKVLNQFSEEKKKEYGLGKECEDLGLVVSFLDPVDSDNESEPCDTCGDTVSWDIYKI